MHTIFNLFFESCSATIELALEECTYENSATDWCKAQISLGVTFRALGEQESDIKWLHESLAALDRCVSCDRTHSDELSRGALRERAMTLALLRSAEPGDSPA